jgi:FAD/FMN-containing dehydrogenase
MWNDFFHLTTTPPALSKAPLRADCALYVLLETLGQDHAGEQTRLAAFLEQAYERGLFDEAVVAATSSQRVALWRIREDSEQIEAQFRPTFSFDISLPITGMENYIQGVRAELNNAFGQVKCWVFGHAADGNLHLGVWGSAIRQQDHEQVEMIIYQPLQALGGSISAEHGIGLEKKSYLHLSRTSEEIAVMRRLKAALDPQGILNPGKIFDLA